MSDDGLDYDELVEDAMRGVVRAALTEAAEHGLPGNHHFYVSFRTGAEGVDIAPRLRAQYPDEMTIVIQHQYWNLLVHEDAFEVTLAFSGKREPLVVPYRALTGFVDPEAQFGLKFGAAAAKRRARAEARNGTGAGGEKAEKIVSLDSFRKK